MTRFNHLHCLLLAGLLLLPAAVSAQRAPTAAEDPARRLLDEERTRQRDERLTRETPEINVTTPTADDGRAPIDVPEVEPAFPIREIIVQGNTRLTDNELKTILAPFRDVPMGINRINLLLRRLTALYLEKGYFTTRCYLGEQNLSEGILVIQVFEGRLESLRYNGAPAPLGVRLAFPVSDGDILRLQDIEQGVEQLNRLRRNQATLSVEPGEQPGSSIVNITNTQGDSRYYTLGFDNAGQASTGRNRLRLGADFEDILGLQESTTLSYTGTRDTNAMLLSSSLPVGYHTYTYTYSYSDYVTPLGGYTLLFGDTNWHNIAWNTMLDRTREGRSSLDVSMGHRQGRRFINDTALTPQRQTNLRVAINRFQQQNWGNWLGEIAWSHGVPLLGADRDPSGLSREAPTNRFHKFAATLDITTLISQEWIWRSTASAQWSRTGLFGSEQITLGGSGSVRGFEENTTSGDRGAYLRSDLQWHGAHWLDTVGIRSQPYLFLDHGHVRQIGLDKGETLTGAGIGARFGGKGLSSEITLGWPIQKPAGVDADSPRLAFTVSYQY